MATVAVSALEIRAAERLRVSVVVVNYGTPQWLRRCLGALIANTPPWYEVIIVENGSPDDSRAVIECDVSGARVLFNDRNLGFGPACNQGAAAARAPALCFLNPDALVEPGWLEPLLERLDATPTAGAVVARLVNWDESATSQGDPATLQEAGCIVGRDGSTQSVGFGDDPDRPWYRFPRVIDYGSFACALVRRSAFETVGGFDPVYAPAYCEDVDLCFALAEAGFDTVYEPRATVFHARGVTMGQTPREALLERNTGILRTRWADRLAPRPSIRELPAFAHRSIAARDALTNGRVLVAGDGVAIAPDIAGRFPRTRITLVADTVLSAEAELLAAGIEVVAGPDYDWVDFFERRWFQYDAVVGDLGLGALGTAVARTQPQAIAVSATKDVEGALAGAGLAA